MNKRLTRKTIISPLKPGGLCSYELLNGHIVIRLFGVLPIRKIRLSEVYYLRLASKDEISPVQLLFNWTQFSQRNQSTNPVYIIQTRSERLFLPLPGGSHFTLRQAIASHKQHRRPALAA